MILIDLNQVLLASVMTLLKQQKDNSLDENLFRHMVLNSLRSYKVKFSNEFGELVIACDNTNYWRKKEFPYYKANRKKNQEASELDWKAIFECLNRIRQELKDNFPYRVIDVESAEADDIIYSLTKQNDEMILILSGDKDYIQLHGFTNVSQYDPTRKKWIKHSDPDRYLYEHVLRGDSSDGIPNILSDADTFVSGKRQKPLTQKKIDELYNLAEGYFRSMCYAVKFLNQNQT